VKKQIFRNLRVYLTLLSLLAISAMVSCDHTQQQLLSNVNYIAQSMSGSDYSHRIATGRFHSAAICADNILWTWGENEDGQLGNGTTEDSSVPIRIMDDVIAISTRDWSHNTSAITSDGTLWMCAY